MKRSLRSFFSTKTIIYLKYVPKSILRVKNWFPFLLNYIGIKNDNFERYYKLRGGIKFKSMQSLDAATIFVICIREDYGDIPNDAIIVDIGANIGVYSIWASTKGKNNKIYAFEPMKDNFELMQENLALNNCNNVISFNYAVASKKEKRKLYLNDAVEHSLFSREDDQEFVEIETVALTNIINENSLDQIDLLKMDCEGAEYEIFYNTPESYFEKIKVIRMEFHGTKEGEKLRDFLIEKGFIIDLFKKGNLWCHR